jgi:hypothetical protein
MRGSLRFAVGFFFACAAVWAQAVSTSQIQGNVQDAAGLAVPGATVKITQSDTGVARTVTTGADGGYVLTSLPIGPYTLEVTKEGFAKYVQTGIVLQVSSAPTIDVSLKLGSVTEQVQVEANAALVETQSTGVGGVIENQRILELPLNGRNAAELVVLAGAAVSLPGNLSSRSMQGSLAISVAGGQSSGVAYQLDGALHNNPFDNFNLPLPFPDALQEFKVETSALTAQNGIHAGASVNAVTKAGTNEFHGDLFEFVRNGKFNARNFFAARRDTLKRNQFGGTVGGPILKNKLFFFGGYQGTRTRSDPAELTTFIPTAQMQAGDFTAFASPSCNAGRQLTLSPARGFVNNRISPSLLDKAALTISSKLPPTSDPCGKILYGAITQQNEYQLVTKVDYQLSAKHSFFGRYMATTFVQPPPYSLQQNLLNTYQGGRDNLTQSIVLGDTYLISPSTVNTFRATFNRVAIHRTNSDFFSAPDIGINTYSYMPHYMLMSITGGFSLGGATEAEAVFHTTTYQIGDDINLIRGSHQFAFGAALQQWRLVWYANVRSPGMFSFDGSVTGSGLADFLIGQLNNATLGGFLESAPNTLFTRQWYFGAYAQDTWKVTRKLTVNYGVRWEPWFPQQVTNNAIYNFDYGRFQQGVRSTVFKNAPAGFYYPGDPGFPTQAGMYRKWGDLGPRVGLAFDPKGDGKMSIRASYGLAYDFVNGQFYANTAIAPPWGAETRIPGPIPFQNPFNNSAGFTNIFPVRFDANAPFSLYGPFEAIKYDQKTTAVHQWNLSIQRQMGKDWLLSATYAGNETQHLWVSTQLNPGQYLGLGACTLQVPTASGGFVSTNFPACSTTGNLNQRRLFSLQKPQEGRYIGFMDVYDDGGTQSYNGLLLSVQKRLSSHVSGGANYTWSHCIGDYSQGFTTPNVGSGYLDPNNRRMDRGNCAFDRRHIFNVTAVVETPRFSNTALRYAATDWKLAASYSMRSGPPLTIGTNLDRQLSGSGGQRVNQVLANPYGNTSTLNNFFNPAAFALPDMGTLGNAGRFAVFGPGFFELDAALSRGFRIRERQSVEVRAEAFNLTNSLRKAPPGATLNITNTFGQILAASDPRIMQFALKYVF